MCLSFILGGRLRAEEKPLLQTTNAAGAATTAETRFSVKDYEIIGNTLLPEKAVQAIVTKHAGTNINFDEVTSVLKELQMEYHQRGYDTVSVTIPQQRLTNGVFKIKVFEGKLMEIVITGNHYFSQENILRALPSLKTNIYLNSKIFQPELDRANANQDRQIYPEIHPGPGTNTSALFLTVEDRLPLHVKLEANNQSSPGTPEMRIAASAVYNNLWQLDHALGVQYTFSEQDYKTGKDWQVYDRPLVANYSGFYRLPLTAPSSIADTVNDSAGSFGYNEATKKFDLPPAEGTPELTVFASGSTIDSGVEIGQKIPVRGTATVTSSTTEETDHQDLTVNRGLGFRISEPLPDFAKVHERMQFGLDCKTFRSTSFETNAFYFTRFLLDTSGNPYTQSFVTPNHSAPTEKSVVYIPLTLRWEGGWLDHYGHTDFSLGYSANLWHDGDKKEWRNLAGSTKASGFWNVLSGSVAREQTLSGEWKLAMRADGQWANVPLISNEQYGVGGVNGVRGFREGEVFGDIGWRVTSEIKTPTHRIGYVGGGTKDAMLVRASIFFDYAETRLLDPQGRAGMIPLFGAGLGGTMNVGRRWNARLLFAWPLLSSPTSESHQLRVSFALSAQF